MLFSYFFLFFSRRCFCICQRCFLYLSRVDRSHPVRGASLRVPVPVSELEALALCRRPCTGHLRQRWLETAVQGAVPLGGFAKSCPKEPARLAPPAGHEGPVSSHLLSGGSGSPAALSPPAWKDAKTLQGASWAPRGWREPALRNRGAARLRRPPGRGVATGPTGHSIRSAVAKVLGGKGLSSGWPGWHCPRVSRPLGRVPCAVAAAQGRAGGSGQAASRALRSCRLAPGISVTVRRALWALWPQWEPGAPSARGPASGRGGALGRSGLSEVPEEKKEEVARRGGVGRKHVGFRSRPPRWFLRVARLGGNT